MPIHEYACEPCDEVFEALILNRGDEERVACPACGSVEVTRLISRPAAARTTGGGRRPGPSCGPVG